MSRRRSGAPAGLSTLVPSVFSCFELTIMTICRIPLTAEGVGMSSRKSSRLEIRAEERGRSRGVEDGGADLRGEDNRDSTRQRSVGRVAGGELASSFRAGEKVRGSGRAVRAGSVRGKGVLGKAKESGKDDRTAKAKGGRGMKSGGKRNVGGPGVGGERVSDGAREPRSKDAGGSSGSKHGREGEKGRGNILADDGVGIYRDDAGRGGGYGKLPLEGRDLEHGLGRGGGSGTRLGGRLGEERGGGLGEGKGEGRGGGHLHGRGGGHLHGRGGGRGRGLGVGLGEGLGEGRGERQGVSRGVLEIGRVRALGRERERERGEGHAGGSGEALGGGYDDRVVGGHGISVAEDGAQRQVFAGSIRDGVVGKESGSFMGSDDVNADEGSRPEAWLVRKRQTFRTGAALQSTIITATEGGLNAASGSGRPVLESDDGSFAPDIQVAGEGNESRSAPETVIPAQMMQPQFSSGIVLSLPDLSGVYEALRQLPRSLAERTVIFVCENAATATLYRNNQILPPLAPLARDALPPPSSSPSPLPEPVQRALGSIASQPSSVLSILDLVGKVMQVTEFPVHFASDVGKAIGSLKCHHTCAGHVEMENAGSWLKCPGKLMMFCFLKLNFSELKLIGAVKTRRSLAAALVPYRVLFEHDEISSDLCSGSGSPKSELELACDVLKWSAGFLVTSDSVRDGSHPELLQRMVKSQALLFSAEGDAIGPTENFGDLVMKHVSYIFSLSSSAPGFLDVLRAILVVVDSYRASRFKSLNSAWKESFAANPDPTAELGQAALVVGAINSFDHVLMSKTQSSLVNFYREGETDVPFSSQRLWGVLDSALKLKIDEPVSLSLLASSCTAIVATRMAISATSIFGFRNPRACSQAGVSVKPNLRRELCGRFAMCACADLEKSTAGKTAISLKDAEVSNEAIVRVIEDGFAGWSIAVGGEGARRSVVMDIEASVQEEKMRLFKELVADLKKVSASSSAGAGAAADRGMAEDTRFDTPV